MIKALLIDDDLKLAKLLENYLSKFTITLTSISDSLQAMDAIKDQKPEVIILDVMMPGINGFDVCRLIRKKHSVPIIMLSARGEPNDKIKGLELGADDYLTKPFYFSELNARIKAIVRRKQFKTNKLVRFANLIIDPDQYLVSVNDTNPISLTKKEYAILAHLVSNHKRVITKVALAEYIWGDYVDEAQSFDFLFSQIRNLKRKLKKAKAQVEIHNIYGVGYQIKCT